MKTAKNANKHCEQRIFVPVPGKSKAKTEKRDNQWKELLRLERNCHFV